MCFVAFIAEFERYTYSSDSEFDDHQEQPLSIDYRSTPKSPIDYCRFLGNSLGSILRSYYDLDTSGATKHIYRLYPQGSFRKTGYGLDPYTKDALISYYLGWFRQTDSCTSLSNLRCKRKRTCK